MAVLRAWLVATLLACVSADAVLPSMGDMAIPIWASSMISCSLMRKELRSFCSINRARRVASSGLDCPGIIRMKSYPPQRARKLPACLSANSLSLMQRKRRREAWRRIASSASGPRLSLIRW